MREIKFRGKGILARKGEWIYGFFKRNRLGDCYIEDEYGMAIAVDPDTVSQIVCHSENDQDIYEGDYLRWHDSDEVYELMWDEDDSLYYITTDHDVFSLADDIKHMTVVGNRWDGKKEEEE